MKSPLTSSPLTTVLTVLTCVLSTVSSTHAQLELVADINQTDSPDQSKPAQFTPFGGGNGALFVATSANEGQELWISDGTPAGTALVKDVRPGSLGSDPSIVAINGSTAYFSANDGTNGRELWKTDGTEAGTALVKDIFPGSADGMNQTGRGGIHSGVLFFPALSSTGNTELWKSDGTEVGTVLVKDIQPNGTNPASSPADFVSALGFMFFNATLSVSGNDQGRELWKTDGTSAGTVMVHNIGPGSKSGQPRGFVEMGGWLFFVADDGSSGLNWEIWKTDGTTTTRVTDLGGPFVTGLTFELCKLGNDTLLFGGQTSTFNRELWKYHNDGMTETVSLVKELRPGTAQFEGSDPGNFTVVGSHVYFTANDGPTGIELYRTDGTAGGTEMVTDLLTGGVNDHGLRVDEPSASAPIQIVSLGSTCYFYGRSNASGGELWQSNGTALGTTVVKELAPGSSHAGIREMKVCGSLIYFSAVTPAGTEPYVSNGTDGGTILLKDIGTGSAGSNPAQLTAIAGKLYLSANDGLNGRELWVSDGTPAGTSMVKNVDPSANNNNFGAIAGLNGTAFFGEVDATGAFSLHRSDGTSAGTYPISGVLPLGPLTTLPAMLRGKAVGNLLFFTADTTANGLELWRTDGTSAGTFLTKDLYVGADDSEPVELTAAGNVLYFRAETDENGRELFRSDGTTAGTKLVKDFNGSSFNSDPVSFVTLGNTLYLNADSPGGSEVWKSNGTTAGTVLVKDVNPGGSASPGSLTALNNTTILFGALYLDYPANITTKGRELFRTNGTAAGTVMVKDIVPGSVGSFPIGEMERGPGETCMAVIDGVAYFSAATPANGRELWKSDGTEAGTVMVKDIIPGATSSQPTRMVVVDDTLYFTCTISGGPQIWKSDGTDAGTVMVDDTLTTISAMVLSGTHLYVAGTRTDVSSELFRLADVRPIRFTITQSPIAQNLAINAALSLSATVTVPVGLPTPTYQWRRNGLAIPGANKLIYSVAKVTEANDGIYDLLVRSGDFEVLSEPAQVQVGDPAKLLIQSQPQPKLVLTGQGATFRVVVLGQTPEFQWFKGTAPIVGATTDTLTLTNIQMTDAGQYKVKITNTLGSLTSSIAQLAVVDSAILPMQVNAGTTAVITAPAVGTGLAYQWMRSGSVMGPGWRNGAGTALVTGAKTAKLGIPKISGSDNASYTCLINLGGQYVTCGARQVTVTELPILVLRTIPPASLPNWIISGPVSVLASAFYNQTNITSKPWNAPISYTITGLPAGMTYDKTTGLITGQPIGGTGVYTFLIRANTSAGSSAPLSVTLITIPLESTGPLRGLVDRNAVLNNNLGHALQVDITTNGSTTGKLMLGTVAFPFTKTQLSTTAGSLITTAMVEVKRPGSTPLTLEFTISATGAVTGTLTDGTNTAAVSGKNCSWPTTGLGKRTASNYDGVYTGVFRLQAGEQGQIAYPQGESYLTATVSLAGAVTGAVRLADGTKVTLSTLLGNAGEVALYIPAYSNTGSLHGVGQITSPTGFINGTLSFFKASQPTNSTTRSYKTGVPLHTLTLVGGPWVKPVSPTLLLGVTDNGAATALNNAKLQFTQGGIDSTALDAAGVYTQNFRIKAPASTFVLPTGAANAGKLTLKFVSTATGEITGTFSSTDASLVPPGAPVPRTATYWGVIVQRLNQGRGHFNLAKLPDGTQPTAAKTEILSGLMEMTKHP